jgi:hypothetical protein
MNRVKKRRIILSLGCVLALGAGTVGTASAVPSHRHCMLTPQGWVEVGPRVFKKPHLHDPAFHNFHFNVHVSGVPTTIEPTTGECSALPIPPG